MRILRTELYLNKSSMYPKHTVTRPYGELRPCCPLMIRTCVSRKEIYNAFNFADSMKQNDTSSCIVVKLTAPPDQRSKVKTWKPRSREEIVSCPCKARLQTPQEPLLADERCPFSMVHFHHLDFLLLANVQRFKSKWTRRTHVERVDMVRTSVQSSRSTHPAKQSLQSTAKAAQLVLQLLHWRRRRAIVLHFRTTQTQGDPNFVVPVPTQEQQQIKTGHYHASRRSG